MKIKIFYLNKGKAINIQIHFSFFNPIPHPPSAFIILRKTQIDKKSKTQKLHGVSLQFWEQLLFVCSSFLLFISFTFCCICVECRVLHFNLFKCAAASRTFHPAFQRMFAMQCKHFRFMFAVFHFSMFICLQHF